MSQEKRDGYFMDLANIASRQSKCLKRHVGAVIVDERGHVKAIGYNGVPSGFPHCTKCVRSEHDSNRPECPSIHAEQNALLQLDDKRGAVAMYTTLHPCLHCAKLIANTSIKEVVYILTSGSGEREQITIEALFKSAGIKLVRLEIGVGGRWARCS
jgi:dCMP deaminase